MAGGRHFPLFSPLDFEERDLKMVYLACRFPRLTLCMLQTAAFRCLFVAKWKFYLPSAGSEDKGSGCHQASPSKYCTAESRAENPYGPDPCHFCHSSLCCRHAWLSFASYPSHKHGCTVCFCPFTPYAATSFWFAKKSSLHAYPTKHPCMTFLLLL